MYYAEEEFKMIIEFTNSSTKIIRLTTVECLCYFTKISTFRQFNICTKHHF
jgi:hypothetical protein